MHGPSHLTFALPVPEVLQLVVVFQVSSRFSDSMIEFATAPGRERQPRSAGEASNLRPLYAGTM
jgi:hypothetical protein